MASTYEDVEFKVPKERDDYKSCSDYVIRAINGIMQSAIDDERNKIIINTNLRLDCRWRISIKLPVRL